MGTKNIFEIGEKFELLFVTQPETSSIRDLEATILKDVCKDVKVEPDLIPIGDSTINSSNSTEGARLDVSAVGSQIRFLK